MNSKAYGISFKQNMRKKYFPYSNITVARSEPATGKCVFGMSCDKRGRCAI
jgi:hypothetical protein